MVVSFTMYGDHSAGVVVQTDMRGPGRPGRTLERFVLDTGTDATRGRSVSAVLDELVRSLSRALSPHCLHCPIGRCDHGLDVVRKETKVTLGMIPGQAQLPLTGLSTIKTALQSVNLKEDERSEFRV